MGAQTPACRGRSPARGHSDGLRGEAAGRQAQSWWEAHGGEAAPGRAAALCGGRHRLVTDDAQLQAEVRGAGPEHGTFERGPKGREEAAATMWAGRRKPFPGCGQSWCKGPEAGGASGCV